MSFTIMTSNILNKTILNCGNVWYCRRERVVRRTEAYEHDLLIVVNNHPFSSVLKGLNDKLKDYLANKELYSFNTHVNHQEISITF